MEPKLTYLTPAIDITSIEDASVICVSDGAYDIDIPNFFEENWSSSI